MDLTGAWQDPWASPVLVANVATDDDYNSRLRDLILQRQQAAPGTTAGVVDAAKTKSDLLTWSDSLIDPLRAWIGQVADALNHQVNAGQDSLGREVDMVAEAWAVVYRGWGYHMMHSHHDSAWSGVYYVHTGKMAEGTGLIEFLDPRPAANARQPNRPPLHRLTPSAGTIIGFPSWLQHWVTPYEGDSDRVCVAFNIGFRH